MKNGIIISLLMISVPYCVASEPSKKTCAKPSKISVKLDSEYFAGEWYNLQRFGKGTDTYTCDFSLTGSFSCHVLEHGPIDKEATIYHADEYWEQGLWSFQNNVLSKAINKQSKINYKVVSATDNDYVISNGDSEFWFTKNKNCLGS